MTLSIIIVSFNTKEFILECLTSLETHYKLYFQNKAFEVIVVDNASTDGSVDAIKKEFSWVKILVLKENQGFAKANNIGVSKANGKVVLFLNPDTIVPAKTLIECLDVLKQNEKTGIVTCKVLLTSGQIDDASHRGFPTPWRALTHFSGLGKLFPQSTLFNGYHLAYQSMETIHEIDACTGAFLMIKREVGKEVQWFDEDYFWYGDDLDLCYRVKAKGYTVLFVPYVTITHYKGIASGILAHSAKISKANEETKRRATKARFEVMRIFYQKHYRKKYPWFITSLVLAGITVKQKMTEFTL